VNPRTTLLRGAATLGVAAVLSGMAAAPAVAADGGVDVLNTETVQIYTSPTGEVETQRVYEQLAMTGTGSVDVSNPISTDGLRNLDGFGGFDVEDGEQVTHMTVDGEEHLRTVSDFTGDLPLDVSVSYQLDGETVEPGDVVGESGELEVLYTVRNITGQPREVSFPDGSGGTTTETVDVPIPMVGSLTTVAPETFTNVRSQQANMAGDGKGGTKLSFTMTLFPPIGSDTAEFGYTADIVDGVVPRADVSALPVNPLESPTFAAAADSYQGGTETGAKLAEGAATIDSNLLKLRDGASELLAGLIKLHEGSAKLQSGLADEAAPGAAKLADGAGQLDDGLGRIADGANQLFDGTGQALDGSRRLHAGLNRLSGGANDLSDGLHRAQRGSHRLAEAFNSSTGDRDFVSGAKELAVGLRALSDGLEDLADANTGLPHAADGATQIRGGVLRILAGVDNPQCNLANPTDPANPCGLVQGLTLLTRPEGLPKAVSGAKTIDGYVQNLKQILPAVQGGVSGARTALGGASTNIAGATNSVQAASQILGCVNDAAAPPGCAELSDAASKLEPAATAVGTADGTLAAIQTPLGQGVAIVNGLSAQTPDLVTGLVTAEAGAQGLLSGAQAISQGAADAGLRQGLDDLVDGLTVAAAGVVANAPAAAAGADGAELLAAKIALAGAGAGELAEGLVLANDGSILLAAGAGDAAAGSGDLTSGLGELNTGAGKLADGTGEAAAGSGKLADGAGKLADGLGDAADGSGKLTDGLGQARDGAPKLVDGAQKLSDKGTSKLVEAGKDTTQTYGQMYATMQAGAERAQVEDMAYGAPEGAAGLTAYSYVIQGEDGEAGRNWSRGLAGMALLGLGGGGFLLRRRLV
jgi:putative membrane protein